MGTSREGLTGTPYEKLVQALDQVVRDFGPDVLTQPDRVRSALSDLLSDDALTLRADLDALVLAAELGIPTALEATEPAPDADELLQRLTDRGATPERAGLALRLWSSSLDTSLPDTVLSALPGAPTTRPEPAATDLPSETPPVVEVAVAAAGGGGGGAPWTVPGSRRRRRTRAPLVLAGVGAALVVALVGGVFVSTGGGKTSKAETVRVERQRNRRHETPTTTTTTTVKPATPQPTTPQPQPQPQPNNSQPQPQPAPEPQTEQPQTEPPTTTTTTQPQPDPPRAWINGEPSVCVGYTYTYTSSLSASVTSGYWTDAFGDTSSDPNSIDLYFPWAGTWQFSVTVFNAAGEAWTQTATVPAYDC